MHGLMRPLPPQKGIAICATFLTGHWTLAEGKLELRWNAAAEPVLALLYTAPDGRKTVLASALTGGSASVDVRGLAPGGAFEGSLASGLKARLVRIPSL